MRDFAEKSILNWNAEMLANLNSEDLFKAGVLMAQSNGMNLNNLDINGLLSNPLLLSKFESLKNISRSLNPHNPLTPLNQNFPFPNVNIN